MLRVKALLRTVSWPSSADANAEYEMPTVAIASPAPSLLLSSPFLDRRLATLADGALAFGSFAADARLRSLFGSGDESRDSPSSSSSKTAAMAAFTGPLRVLQTPSLGSLKPASIRASQLRGMSSSESGASGAGSENSLGFKVRRKGFKVDVMGRDLVAGGGGGGEPSVDSSSHGRTATEAASEHSTPSSTPTATVTPPSAAKASIAVEQPVQQSSPPRGPALKGLAALRARGLQARQQGQGQGHEGQGGGQNDALSEQAGRQARDLHKQEALSRAAQEEW